MNIVEAAKKAGPRGRVRAVYQGIVGNWISVSDLRLVASDLEREWEADTLPWSGWAVTWTDHRGERRVFSLHDTTSQAESRIANTQWWDGQHPRVVKVSEVFE